MAIKELEYLQELKRKFGSDYIQKYFGFTFGEIGQKIGLKKANFSMILTGRQNLPKKHEQRFIEVFNEMKIIEKTKDFKESESQLLTKYYNRKLRNILTGFIFLLYFSFMNLALYTKLKLDGKTNNFPLIIKAFNKKLSAFFVFLNSNLYFLQKKLNLKSWVFLLG